MNVVIKYVFLMFLFVAAIMFIIKGNNGLGFGFFLISVVIAIIFLHNDDDDDNGVYKLT